MTAFGVQPYAMAKTRRPLVTERDVARAAREPNKSLDVRGATITPSARDAARALGVTLHDVAPQQRAEAVPVTEARPKPLRVAVGADHGGRSMKDHLFAMLKERGFVVTDCGTTSTEPVDYPDFAVAVAHAVASGAADLGIMVDGAGIGSCMAANKVRGVRAAMCYDVTTAANAREHNNANVLTLGGTLIGNRLAGEIVSTFVTTPFGGGRHAARVAKIDALDSPRS